MLRCYRIDGEDIRPDAWAVREVAQAMLAGNLAVIPTETVYGIGVAISAVPAAESAQAGLTVNGVPLPPADSGYRRIFSVKHRDLTQTVPWLVSGPEDLDRFGCNIDPATRALANELWPGALTLVVQAAPNVPRFMQAADGTVALRASASPVVQALVRSCGCPLAVTSANTHGMPAPTSCEAVELAVLEGADVAIDAGPTPCQDASTIVSVVSGTLSIIRQGALSAHTIERVVAAAMPEACPPQPEKV
ncbi:MAG TPA: L-threonylcarbamoyladenylate synthase [Candidatus Limicola stercorigallinarum]|nr:L-threonylcarbamoyladenylate synthase [Candidatus Limicola stercorigallinarum]